MTQEFKCNDVVVLSTGETGWIICKSEHDDTYLIELEVGKDIWVPRDLISLYEPNKESSISKESKKRVLK